MAALLSVHPLTLAGWARKGLVPSYRGSTRNRRYDPDAVFAALAAREKATS